MEIGCAPAPCAPWPLRLPWHLSAADGEPLAGCCGWSFELICALYAAGESDQARAAGTKWLQAFLTEQHPDLDPFTVADWVCGETGGVFADTVEALERLHDTGFQAAYDALRGPRP
ncbi:hypothetical protein [uncultured Thiodictyon sp.]|uniref:hypothetical protein n=1 Tax=uncultured Thiodictyon sp. TaxID=1846217 RepID=UPI0025E63897|nr:hypothetical protein [uncultured Thiodictyon sp.]